jgi:DNA invertase Pin-like site-specific DNA recombinase
MKTAVTYLRVSSVEQVGNTSLDDQDSCTRTFISMHGWKLLRVFREEGKSAKDGERPEFKALQRFCRDNRVDYVVALDTSRFSRNLDVFTTVRKSLESSGTRLAFVFGVAGDNAEARFATNVAAAAAEYDNAQRATKSKRGTDAVRRAGGWTTRPPKGYILSRAGRLPTLIPSPDAEAVRRAFAAVAMGKKNVREAGRDIGISKGEEFFVRPVFAGYQEIDGELVRGSWPGIVPLATWYRVQERMKHRQHNKRTDFFLRGHLVCECGRMLTASYSQGRHARYGYYHCMGCKARHPARKLEDAYREWVASIAAENSGPVAEIKKQIVSKLKDLVAEAEESKAKAAAESARISRRISALVDLHLDGAITRDEYDAKRAALLAQRADLQQEILLGPLSGGEYLELLDDATRVLADFPQFLGVAGHADMMNVAKMICGSKVSVSRAGEFSNRENDCLYWLLSHSDTPVQSLARLTGDKSNQNFALAVSETVKDPKTLKSIAYRLKLARAILTSVLDADSQKEAIK